MEDVQPYGRTTPFEPIVPTVQLSDVVKEGLKEAVAHVEYVAVTLNARVGTLIALPDSPQWQEDAGAALRDIQAEAKGFLEAIDPAVKSAFEFHRSMTKRRDDVLAPLHQIMANLKNAIAIRARERKEMEERVRREAAEAAERERRRIERENEKARLAHEAEVRRIEAENKRIADERAAQLAAAKAGEAPAPPKKIAFVAPPPPPVERVYVAPPVVAAPPPEKVAGAANVRMVKKGRVVDRLAFIRAVASGLEGKGPMIPDGVLDVNDGALNRFVQAFAGAVSIPGVEIYEESSVRAGRTKKEM